MIPDGVSGWQGSAIGSIIILALLVERLVSVRAKR
jgi:hypothetical protein